jgi:hypothetical protein
MPKQVWLRLNVQPGFELLIDLCETGCFYNGNGYIKAEDEVTADEAISHLRAKGYEVTRSKPPEQQRLTGWTSFAVSSSIDFPKRIFV